MAPSGIRVTTSMVRSSLGKIPKLSRSFMESPLGMSRGFQDSLRPPPHQEKSAARAPIRPVDPCYAPARGCRHVQGHRDLEAGAADHLRPTERAGRAEMPVVP